MGTVSRAFLFHAKTNTRIVSRVAAASSFLLSRFGMAPGGKNVGFSVQREDSYDVFNATRTIAQVRNPRSGSAPVNRQKAGSVRYAIPHSAEHQRILLPSVTNQRPLGGTGGEVDQNGQDEIARQQRYMGQRVANFRLALLGGLLRGKLYVQAGSSNADEQYLSYTSSSNLMEINLGRHSGNEEDVDAHDKPGETGSAAMYSAAVFADKWDNGTVNIPKQLMLLNRTSKAQTGGSIELAVTGSGTWDYLVNNDFIRAQAGISNTPFDYIRRREGGDADNGLPPTEFEAKFPSMPWMNWLMSDEVVQMGTAGSEAITSVIPPGYVWFGPDPQKTRDLMEMLETQELVREKAGAPAVLRRGVYAWVNDDEYDPPVAKLHTKDDALAVMYSPNMTYLVKVLSDEAIALIS